MTTIIKEPTPRKYNWPTREEWAYRRQHPYWDYETGCPFHDKYSHDLSSYGTAEEIAATIRTLEELWRRYGHELRELNRKGSPLYPQPNEREFYRRHMAMSEAEKEIASRPYDLKTYRHFIRKILVVLRDDSVPSHGSWGWEAGKEPNAVIEKFKQRYDAAFKAAREEWERECEKIPVGDAEWEAELRWRKSIEERDADPEKRFVLIPRPQPEWPGR